MKNDCPTTGKACAKGCADLCRADHFTRLFLIAEKLRDERDALRQEVQRLTALLHTDTVSV